MNPPLPSPQKSPQDRKGQVRNGMEVPFFKPGSEGPQIGSAKDMNVLVSIARALVNPKIVQGDAWDWRLSDSDICLQLGVPQSAALTQSTAPTTVGCLDSACYDSTDDLIIAVRGGRVYKCDPSTGNALAQSDYGQIGFGGSIVWDSGTNRCFASCRDQVHIIMPGQTTDQGIYRIIPSTLAVDMTLTLQTSFGITPPASAGESLANGVFEMFSVSGTIYATVISLNALIPLKFLASNPATFALGSTALKWLWPRSCEVVSGSDVIIYPQTANGAIKYTGFPGAGTIVLDSTKAWLALTYAPVQAHLFATEQFRYVYVYNLAGSLLATVDTGRANFNGICAKYNSVDGFVYVAGFADGSVAVIDPATNGVTIKTGFDLPVDFCFTGTKKFAVQQGSLGLKEIV